MALPHGYDSQVGELGDTLSAGEKQRLGLARAFLHGADLLLLDEPTSNLDALNEAQILRSLAQDQERSSRTVVKTLWNRTNTWCDSYTAAMVPSPPACRTTRPARANRRGE